jgi:hypothetical protein
MYYYLSKSQNLEINNASKTEYSAKLNTLPTDWALVKKGDGRGRHLRYIQYKWLTQDGWDMGVLLLHVKCIPPRLFLEKITTQNFDTDANRFK